MLFSVSRSLLSPLFYSLKAVTFVEDMTAEEKALKVEKIPAGLTNLGNTCYMNATVQCLRHLPELRDALRAVQLPPGVTLDRPGIMQLLATHQQLPQVTQPLIPQVMAGSLSQTCTRLDGSGAAIEPVEFVHLLRAFFQQFDERSEQSGAHKQQDAEEFFSSIAGCLRQALPGGPSPNSFESVMGVELETTDVCQESADEPPVVRRERPGKLVCNISGGTAGTKVDRIDEGLRLAMEENGLIKTSELLGRNAIWTRRSRLANLPRVICFQFMRFFWNATPGSADHAGVKAKIMRAVTYPDVMDVYDLCTPQIQEALRANRIADDKRLEEEMRIKRAKLSAELKAESEGVADMDVAGPSAGGGGVSKAAAAGGGGGGVSSGAGAGVAMEIEGAEDMDPDELAALKAAMAFSVSGELPPTPTSSSGGSSGVSSVFGFAAPEDFLGYYELAAIVTHKGRSADSGHYIGWARKAEGSDVWFKFDDARVDECSTADVLKLSGGGDHDTAYLNFYRMRTAKRHA